MTDKTYNGKTIDPASVAGILLREFDTPEKAIEYAGKMAKLLLAAHNAIGLDYLEAIKQIDPARFLKACGIED
jgi:hypothetical protein